MIDVEPGSPADDRGLQAGDTVATSNVAQLTDGARVAERR